MVEKTNKENVHSMESASKTGMELVANNTITFADARMVKNDDGTEEPFEVERLRASITKKAEGLNTKFVKLEIITEKVSKGIYSGITRQELADLTAETAAYLTIVHPEYSVLANRIAVSALHTRTEADIGKVADILFNFTDSCNRPAPLLSKRCHEVMTKHAEKINAVLDHTRDFNYDFFGFKTLERAYLLRIKDKKIAERPQ